MAVALVDTAVLVGMVDTDDRHHDVALEIVRGIDRGDLPRGRVTDYVILETLNWTHGRQHSDKAQETHTRLNESAGFETRDAPQKDFTRALELFERYDGLSLATRPSWHTWSVKGSSTCTLSTPTSTRSMDSPG